MILSEARNASYWLVVSTDIRRRKLR